MGKSLFLLVFVATLINFNLLGQTPCNTIQNLNSNQLLQLNNLKPALDTALYYEDFSDIDSISIIAKNIYGSQGGYPESLESYYTLTNNTKWLDLPNSINLSRVLIDKDSIYYSKLWRLAKGESPMQAYAPNSIYLRYSAEVALGFLKIADKETDLNRKLSYTNWAIQALDSLATMQLPSGAFPFPDLRTYNDPLFSPMIQAFLKSCGADSVNVLVNGWIVDDKGSGQFKFDAGVIADAYYQAYLYTNKLNYKNIAVSIGNYLINLKFNTNYNYNSFVSLGLTRAFQLTNDSTYLKRAITNIRYGVLPGQLSNGRWVDGHNAKSIYHAIILKNISVTLNLIPTTNENYDNLKNMLIKAISNYVEYYTTCNYSGTYYWAMRCYLLNSSILDQSLKDSIADLIGKHINQSAINGKFLDVLTMGDYLELFSLINTVPENYNNNVELIFFPNPASTILLLNLSFSDDFKIIIRNFVGQTVYSAKNETQIDISNLTNGVYFISIDQGLKKATYKFIKQ
jgi:hypothetical protein